MSVMALTLEIVAGGLLGLLAAALVIPWLFKWYSQYFDWVSK